MKMEMRMDQKKLPFTFWNGYVAALKAIWTTPSWYVLLFAIFAFGLRGNVHHPVRVSLGILFLGCVAYPIMGYAYMKIERHFQS